MHTDTRQLWLAWANGEISDDAAQAIAEAHHRATPTSGTTGPFKNPRTAFPARRPQRSPDRQRSIERRRRLAMSGPMPPNLACQFTVGELAVLRIVANEAHQHGGCRLHLDAIAARAGVCRRLAQMAIRRAERLGLLSVTERRISAFRNDTNVVRVVDKAWVTWLDRGTGCKKIPRTGTNINRDRKVAKITRLGDHSGHRIACGPSSDGGS